MPSRAWIDYPGHIWVQRANEGAIYSPDGFTLQFDHGTIWRFGSQPRWRRRPLRLFEVAGKVVSRASAVIILPFNSHAKGRTSQTAHIALCEGVKASPQFRTQR
jgi:hypothetical protein